MARGNGGWERDTIAGHTLGHYLTACALTCAQTGDEAFRARVGHIIHELATCQEAEGDGYVAGITCNWHPGDQVVVTLPMKLRIESTPDDPDTVALLYGPSVLAADPGPADGPEPKLIPSLVSDNLLGTIEQTDGPEPAFRTNGAARPEDVVLRPFHRLQDRRYAIYFRRHTAPQWEAHKALMAKESHQSASASPPTRVTPPARSSDAASRGSNTQIVCSGSPFP